MFKKNISAVQHRQASGKDSKQLRRDVQVGFTSPGSLLEAYKLLKASEATCDRGLAALHSLFTLLCD